MAFLSLKTWTTVAVAAACVACGSSSPPDAADATADGGVGVDASDGSDAPALPPQFTVLVTSALSEPISDWAVRTAVARVATLVSSSPTTDLLAGRGIGIVIAAVTDMTCTECYRLEQVSAGFVVHAGDLLGLQYGLTHLLEAFGYRFFHPFAGHSVANPAAAVLDPTIFGPSYSPQQSLRGLQLWTLHPIEALGMWDPAFDDDDGARTIIDWLIRNRGNAIYFAALGDILQGRSDAWRAHMQSVLDEAHLRGIRVGVDVQLFGGASSLQNAFTLLASPSDPTPMQTITSNLHTLTDGLTWDNINVSLGEFSATDPTTLIADLDLAKQVLDMVAPGTQMTALIHVGCGSSLQVSYMGQTLEYYFLVQYADPSIEPWVHTVMYDTLFDPTAGAYGCANFADHETFLLQRLAASRPVAYNPESAYWVDFDDSVPQYLPVYIFSRWRDLDAIAQQAVTQGSANLSEHVMFSSGWEWGYWQQDAAVLRMGFTMPDHWWQPVDDMFGPWGAAGQAAAAAIAQLGEAQFDALVTQQLAAYIAGRDSVLDGGASRGDVSQPPRPQFSDIVAMSPADRATFSINVLAPLDALATATDAAVAAIGAISVDSSDPWFAELRDGVEVDAARAHFAADVWHAAESFASSGTDGGYLASAQQQLASGRAVVARRHSNLHWPAPMRLRTRFTNPTIYQFGYLYYAESLCYWQRELDQVTGVVMGTGNSAPACTLL